MELIRPLIFGISSSIIFGEASTKISNINWISLKTGEISQIDIPEAFGKVLDDAFYLFSQNPWLLVFDHCLKLGMGKLIKNFHKNNKQILSQLQEYTKVNKDPNSIFRKIVSSGYDEETSLTDLYSFMGAASDTVIRLMMVFFFIVWKDKNIGTRLEKEMETHFKKDDYTRDEIEECVYLSFFIRELLRWDTPANGPFAMKTYDDVTLSDITLKKDTIIFLNVQALHKNEGEWHSPHEFIPEGFDPESKYFNGPDGKPRSKTSFIPFGFGPGMCPG